MITEEKGIELMGVYFDEWRRATKIARESGLPEDWLYARECMGSYNTMKYVLEVENG
jgi:hypothetical protein